MTSTNTIPPSPNPTNPANDKTKFVELLYYDSNDVDVDMWRKINNYIQSTGFRDVQIRHVGARHQDHDQWFAAYLHLEEDVIVKVQGPLERYQDIMDQADWYASLGTLANNTNGQSLPPTGKAQPNNLFHWMGSHRGHDQWVSIYVGMDPDFLVKVGGPAKSYDKMIAYANWYQTLGRVDLGSIDVLEG